MSPRQRFASPSRVRNLIRPASLVGYQLALLPTPLSVPGPVPPLSLPRCPTAVTEARPVPADDRSLLAFLPAAGLTAACAGRRCRFWQGYRAVAGATRLVPVADFAPPLPVGVRSRPNRRLRLGRTVAAAPPVDP